MLGRALLARQVAKVRQPSGGIDVAALLQLVETTYAEKEIDRKRADRAAALAAEELSEASTALQQQNIRFKAALDNMDQGLCMFAADGGLVVCNARFREIYDLTGLQTEHGERLDALLLASRALSAATLIERRFLIAEHLATTSDDTLGIEQTWPDGRIIAISRRRLADGGILLTVCDMTATRQAAARISHMARHDALTDLPNRVQFRERLHVAVTSHQGGSRYAVLCLDLDRFKFVNDTLGHPIGDKLLIAVARRLRQLVRKTDMVARLGGDEFAVVMSLDKRPDAATLLAGRIIDTLGQPYLIDGHDIRIGASVGVETLSSGSGDPDDVLRNADLALYSAKAEGGSTWRQFETRMHDAATHRRQLEIDLRSALEADEFEVHYQPQIDLRSNRICGFEALARWRHPVRGLVSPLEFIGLCEELGLIEQLSDTILRKACSDAARWPAEVMVAVNLSALQFRSGRLIDAVQAALSATGLPPERLELEITETAMIEDPTQVLDQLRRLKALGVHISLDDFGTGYSSLSYIRRFPFDRVKIDQSFVRDLGGGADSLAIIRAVAGMCGSLGITTTAEGVETTQQLEILTREHCDSVQGFLFGRPMPRAEAERLLQATQQNKAA